MQTFGGFICPNFSSMSQKNKNTFFPCGLNYFKNMNALVTNGKPGHLQFYSVNTDKLLFNVNLIFLEFSLRAESNIML